jgi:lysozyme family protein
MTDRIWGKAKDLTLNVEGDYQCDPNDKGNWTSGKIGVGELKGTKYGISAMSYPHLDIKNITKDFAEYLYKRDYWDRNKCNYMPDALSIAVFDYVFLSGKQAIKDLQASLGVKVDGIIGNQTIGACNSKPLKPLINEYFNRRIQFITELGNKPKYSKYKKGWLNRVNHIKTVCEGLV